MKRTAKSFRLRVRCVPEKDIPISCRVRLARNFRNHIFPDRASQEERAAVVRDLQRVLAKHRSFKVFDLDAESPRECSILAEKRLISKELLDRTSGKAIISTPDASMVAMINEEDHLRIQGFARSLDFSSAFDAANAFDDFVGEQLPYAWTPRLGFLTACPSNVGTGLRASAMLHLIGLRLCNELDCTSRGLERLHLLVRGSMGEGTDALGQFVQISNMETLGTDEATIIARMTRICQEVIRLERDARIRMIQNSPMAVADLLTRAICLLQNALLISAMEATELLSALRFGASIGIVTGITLSEIDALMYFVQPAHLETAVGTDMMPEARDTERAQRLHACMNCVGLKL